MPDATVSVEATFVTSDSVLVQWTAVPDTACDKISYTITYHRVTNSSNITVYTTDTSILLSGLTGGTTYNITVMATNSIGIGPPSEELVYTATQPPSTQPPSTQPPSTQPPLTQPLSILGKIHGYNTSIYISNAKS